MTKLDDDVKALQIRVAVLESLLLQDEALRTEYERLLKLEAERLLLEATSNLTHILQ